MTMKKCLLFLGLVFFAFQMTAQEVEHSHSIHHSFIENKGQWNKNVLFQSKLEGGNLWVEQGRMLFHLQDYSSVHDNHINPSKSNYSTEIKNKLVEARFVDAQLIKSIEKKNPTGNYYNYFIGNDPEKWASNVRGYSEATLKNLYDGIHLRLIEQKHQLKYEFLVQPEIDPTQIKIEYSGQKNIQIDRKGNLVIATDLGKIIEQKPYAYQIVNGKIKEVECHFHLENNRLTFELGTYVDYVELVIDPVLVFATYSGSITDNFGMTATYGYDGTAYSGGIVFGNRYPTPVQAYDTTGTFTNIMPTANDPAGQYGITDVFVSKYSADGTQMLWTTFLGGGNDTIGTETVHSLICDQNNNIYLYGATSSLDFPIQNGYQTTNSGGEANTNFTSNGVHHYHLGTDIFVSKVSANGQNLMGSTYIGGSSNDGLNYNQFLGLYDSLATNYGDQFRGEIMLDNNGNCIVASATRSTDFPTLNAFQSTNAGKQDGVLFRLSSDLSTLQWSSYFGGSDNDACYSVKVDSSYDIVFAGGTISTDLPLSNGWQTAFNGGDADGFVGKVDPVTNSLTAVSYVGTVNYDQAFFVEIDRNDNVFLLGQSAGGQFPVFNSSYVNPNSSQFVMKLSPDLTTNLNSTVFGNGNAIPNISPSAFLVDICGNMYISGWGASLLQNIPMSGMPVSSNAFQSSSPNGFDFYLAVIERGFQGLLYGSYIGGANAREHVDGGTSRFDKDGIVYQSACGGCGGHSDFPASANAWSTQNLSGNCNNLVFKFDFELIPKAEFTANQTIGCAPFTVTFDNTSSESDSYLWDFGNGDTSSIIFEPTVTFPAAGTYQIYLYVTDSVCLLTDSAEIIITVTDSLELNMSADIELCEPVLSNFTAFTNGTGTQFIWSTNSDFSDTLNANLSDSVLSIVPPAPTTYYVQASNPGCSKIDSVQVSFIGSDLILSGTDSICLGEQVTITATNTNPSFTFTYNWSPDSVILTGNGTSQILIQPSVSQYVVVEATANNGCVVNDSLLISVGNIPDSLVSASALEYSIPQGGATTLTGTPTGSGYSYQWTPTTGVVNPNVAQTEVVMESSNLFTFLVTDGICLRSDTVQINVYGFVCGEPYVYIPNAFTPNGDGENDMLYVRGAPIAKMVFRIFNRWGEMVFETKDRLLGWDGTYKGKMMTPDVYDYYLEAECVDGTESIIKGNVTLMR